MSGPDSCPVNWIPFLSSPSTVPPLGGSIVLRASTANRVWSWLSMLKLPYRFPYFNIPTDSQTGKTLDAFKSAAAEVTDNVAPTFAPQGGEIFTSTGGKIHNTSAVALAVLVFFGGMIFTF